MTKFNAVAIATLGLLSSLAVQAQSTSKVYIVQLKDEPAASYQGTTAGYAATQAAPGTAFRSRTPAALAYSGYLRNLQLSVLSTVSTAPAISQFDTVINGFTARLTPAQAAALALNPRRRNRHRRSVASPGHRDHAGLPRPDGTRWRLVAARFERRGHQGRGHGARRRGPGHLAREPVLCRPCRRYRCAHVQRRHLGLWTASRHLHRRLRRGRRFRPGGSVQQQADRREVLQREPVDGPATFLDWTSFNSPRDDLPAARRPRRSHSLDSGRQTASSRSRSRE